ncbi:hypothetical protein DH86_00003697, partial [Scytalidium sp. 3C]
HLALPFKPTLREVKFTGSPRFYDNGTTWKPKLDKTHAIWPENLTFFGPQSDEIDDAWEGIWEPFGFSISEEEAKAAWGDKHMQYRDPINGKYTAGYIDADQVHVCRDLGELKEYVLERQEGGKYYVPPKPLPVTETLGYVEHYQQHSHAD